MSTLLPELPELAGDVTIRAMIVVIRDLLIWGAVVGIIGAITYFAQAILWLLAQTIGRANFSLGPIHVNLGKWIVGGVSDIVQGLSNQLGIAVTKTDQSAGKFMYGLRSLYHSVGQEILGLSILAGYLVWYVAKKFNPAAIISRITHTQTQVKRIEHQVKPLHGKAIAQTAPAPAVIPVPVPAPYPIPKTRTAAPPVSVPRVRTGEVPNLFEQVKKHTKAITRLWDWIRGNGKYLAGLGAVALVSTAMARLGVQWVRCRNWQRLGRGVCGLPSSSISGLLSLLTDVLVLVNVCQLIPLLETAASDVAVPLVAGLTDIGAGICHGEKPAATLTGPPAILPPVYFTPGSLILPT